MGFGNAVEIDATDSGEMPNETVQKCTGDNLAAEMNQPKVEKWMVRIIG
jgi:hypothetical protein